MIMNHIAEAYVKLALVVGQHDSDFVDAYFGPPEYQKEAETKKRSLDVIKNEAKRLLSELRGLKLDNYIEIERLRHQYLTKQLQSMIARIEILEGKKMSFDDESKALYDAIPTTFSESHFQEILNVLGSHLPGKGDVSKRFESFKKDFIIPLEKLDKVFKAAIDECRSRTKKYIELPTNESFTLEYVNNKPWSGYNWYKGSNYSLIQINTDLPIYIDRAVDLAAHEGYPGHHVYNSLLETNIFRKREWIEFSIYVLFSSQSLIAEGTANYGIDVVFPGDQRIKFEKEVLFPLAGLNSQRVEEYYKVHDIFLKLAYAGNEAARQYLDGKINRDEAAKWLVKYALMSSDRAQQRTRFFDKYRSYVINYNLGQDLVKKYIERRAGTENNPTQRWEEFKRLISSPRLPSSLS